MSLNSNKDLGVTEPARKVLAELQGFTQSLVAGATANTAMALAGIEAEDTIVAVIDLTTPAQLSAADFTVADRRASGTLTIGAVANGTPVVVNGKTYTFTSTAESIAASAAPGTCPIAATAALTAARLAKVIMSSDSSLVATSASNVVTIKSRTAGTAGNAVTLSVAGSGGTVTASGATLAGGTATASISGANSTAAKNLLVTWFNKQ